MYCVYIELTTKSCVTAAAAAGSQQAPGIMQL